MILKYETKRHIDAFIASFILISFFGVICFLLWIGKQEADIGDSVIKNFLADNAINIFWTLYVFDYLTIENSNLVSVLILALLIVNITIYAFIMTILLKRIMGTKFYEKFYLTYYSVVSIVIILIFSIIYTILTER